LYALPYASILARDSLRRYSKVPDS
jgi:hypothetical protein